MRATANVLGSIAILLAAIPVCARYFPAESITSTTTWAHDYHFPKYSIYCAVVFRDENPERKLQELEKLVIRSGGVRQNLRDAQPLPVGLSQARYNIPHAGLRGFKKALGDMKSIVHIQSQIYEDATLNQSHNPRELIDEHKALRGECSSLKSLGQTGRPLNALCLNQLGRIEDFLAAYKLGDARARLVVAVEPPGMEYVPEEAPWTDEPIYLNSWPIDDAPDKPGYWSMYPEGHCASTTAVRQISFTARAPLDASAKVQDLLTEIGAHSLPDDCRLPTRLQPGQKREQLIQTFNYAVPQERVRELVNRIQEQGNVVYDGPLNVRMWVAATEKSATKHLLLAGTEERKPPMLDRTPAFKTFVESKVNYLADIARSYNNTVGSEIIHLVVMRER